MQTNSTTNISEIARTSGSNLAFALLGLPPERKRDMRVFYAFCREVDDIADSLELGREEKLKALDRWEAGLRHGFTDPRPLETGIAEVRERYAIRNDLLLEIVEGVRMDADFQPFATFKELKAYCHHVACAVGLVSIEIFGYRNPDCRRYAVDLGYALQLTNILRDVGEDVRELNRIYLPAEDMERFGVTPDSLRRSRRDDAFLSLMEFEAQRADECFAAAAAHLPREDRRSMRSARLMGAIYRQILMKMRRDGFRVFQKRYRLSKPAMLWALARSFF